MGGKKLIILSGVVILLLSSFTAMGAQQYKIEKNTTTPSSTDINSAIGAGIFLLADNGTAVPTVGIVQNKRWVDRLIDPDREYLDLPMGTVVLMVVTGVVFEARESHPGYKVEMEFSPGIVGRFLDVYVPPNQQKLIPRVVRIYPIAIAPIVPFQVKEITITGTVRIIYDDGTIDEKTETAILKIRSWPLPPTTEEKDLVEPNQHTKTTKEPAKTEPQKEQIPSGRHTGQSKRVDKLFRFLSKIKSRPVWLKSVHGSSLLKKILSC